MAISIDRLNGQHYADNIANFALSFNNGSWTVAGGTGSVALDTNNKVEGLSSLRIQNNVVSSPITVTNSNQNTVIGLAGDYQISWYLKKDIAQEVRNVNVLIYEDAVLLDTQPCVLGSTDADLDFNNIWHRFQSTQTYTFSKGSVITFQFQLLGATTAELTTFVYVDALMINQAGRKNAIVPYYGKPIASPVITGTGWAQYIDTTATIGSPLTIAEGVTATFTNNANTVIDSQKPVGVTTFFDSATQKITPQKDGDAYSISLRFKAKASVLNAYFDVLLDIGGTQGIISQETCIFTRAANIEQRFDVDLTVFSADTFVANGGALTINAISGDLEIYGINFLIVRTHEAI